MSFELDSRNLTSGPGIRESAPLPNSRNANTATPSQLRSCHACYQRKVRCNKSIPCSWCAKNGKPCSYPPTGTRVRRSRKAIIADMTAKIASLEKELAKTKTKMTHKNLGPEEPAKTARHATTSITYQTRRSKDLGTDDVVIRGGSASQYFNEILLSQLLKQEYNNIQQGLQRPTLQVPQFKPAPYFRNPFDVSGILSTPCSSQTATAFHPPQRLALKLWDTYLSKVEGCTVLKLLHIPTDEIKVYSTIEDPTNASSENLALCFAIYFGATVSMDSPEESTAVLGPDRTAHLLSFKTGLEQALAQGNFLESPTLTYLQALVIYLSTIRVRNHGKSIWILNGLALRIAQSLGLHQDGERLGVCPFESEVRRRLWWHLLSKEGRAGEDYGLESSDSFSVMSSGVSIPLNIEDQDLCPEMTSLPLAREGWTAMTFPLIHIDLALAMHELAVSAMSSARSSPPSEHVRDQVIARTRERVEARLQNCNAVIPQQRLTIACSYFLLRKFEFTTRLQWAILGRNRQNVITEKNLEDALQILEPQLGNEEPQLVQYSWIRKAYPQYHVALYILWHLCLKPKGPNVERAWKLIDLMFASNLADDSTQVFTKTSITNAFLAKAIAIRKCCENASPPTETVSSSEIGGQRDESEEQSAQVMGIELGSSSDDNSAASQGLAGEDDWPNWTTLFESFRPDGDIACTVFWQ